jgi:signal transduction histidine kinase/CheY-like chemotaxis protein
VNELQAAIRDSTRLTQLFTILAEPAPLPALLDRLVLALSALFAADVVAVLPAPGEGEVAPLGAIGLPEDPALPPFTGAPGTATAAAAARLAPVVARRGDADPALEAPLAALGVEVAVHLPAMGARAVQGVLVLARCQPLPFAPGEVDLLAAMAHRVGLALEHARAEAERRRLEARHLQVRKAESLSRMAGAIAHRFNNLLGAALGSLEAARAGLPAGHPAQDDLGPALDAVREAAQVSGLMLASLGQASGPRVPLDLAALVREALEAARPSLPRAVRLTAALPGGPLPVLGDEAALRALLGTLLANAWEAIDGAGEIAVTLSEAPASALPPAPPHSPGWHPAAEAWACLEVRDTGCGMDAAALQSAFDPFFTTKFAGRGLGLPVALGTAHAHGGTIEAESAPGRGSRFRAWLPRRAGDLPAARPAPAAAPAPAGGRGLALVVDDEPTMRRAMERLLRKVGFQVITAADGVEALELFRPRAAEVAVVLLDVTMPRMDGWQTLAALRALRPATPVVLASGYDEAQVMGGAAPERPPVFLKKPFTWEELEAAMARAAAEAAGAGRGP